jgi:hypothetical protein
MRNQRGRIEPARREQVDNSVPNTIEVTNAATNLLLVRNRSVEVEITAGFRDADDNGKAAGSCQFDGEIHCRGEPNALEGDINAAASSEIADHIHRVLKLRVDDGRGPELMCERGAARKLLDDEDVPQARCPRRCDRAKPNRSGANNCGIVANVYTWQLHRAERDGERFNERASLV